MFSFVRKLGDFRRRGQARQVSPVTVVQSRDRDTMDETIKERALAAIDDRSAVIVLDAYGNSLINADLSEAARAAGRPFLEVTPHSSGHYRIRWDRLTFGQICAIAFAGIGSMNDFYECAITQHLANVLRVLSVARTEPNLYQLAHYCQLQELKGLMARLRLSPMLGKSEDLQQVTDSLQSMTGHLENSIAGMASRLRLIVSADVGQVFGPCRSDLPTWDLIEFVRERGVLYVNLERDQSPLLADVLVAVIAQDLQNVRNVLIGCGASSLLAITRFSGISEGDLKALLQWGRSASMSLLLDGRELGEAYSSGLVSGCGSDLQFERG